VGELGGIEALDKIFVQFPLFRARVAEIFVDDISHLPPLKLPKASCNASSAMLIIAKLVAEASCMKLCTYLSLIAMNQDRVVGLVE
jgi:hypothetical protein